MPCYAKESHFLCVYTHVCACSRTCFLKFLAVSCISILIKLLDFEWNSIVISFIHLVNTHTHTQNKHYYVNTYYTNIQFRNQFFHLSSTQIVKCLSVRQRREECVLLYELLMKHYIKKAC